ncbi:HAD-IA family hydrolase [Corticimicrobacter populi]|uniref:phosphoglycolate phosphatase n=1 Tax=Corticimicrobacter populi TaxID=2175229 RepID=A0A2V1JXE2_9BURK|nr:HAD-IA family hydrolase [Corticimicrobacter populi]PWF23037.1 phosphoglycolate phosphatase [Corticimicrobacter populi]
MRQPSPTPLILFDFDGTLADTAPDLAAAANQQRQRQGLPPLDHAPLREVASQGARGLLRVALGLEPDSTGYEAARLQFLADYEARMTLSSTLFDGIAEMLVSLDVAGIPWGIVTNKATRLTLPLVRHFGLLRSRTVVCGDTTAHIKPHPEPLLHAARLAGHGPTHCIYIGDDLRDIQAGKAAGMRTIAVAYGYSAGTQAAQWQADACVEQPQHLYDSIVSLLAQS